MQKVISAIFAIDTSAPPFRTKGKTIHEWAYPDRLAIYPISCAGYRYESSQTNPQATDTGSDWI
jgi:hypothetical protein